MTIPNLHPPCALCEGTGRRAHTGFTGRTVENACTLCKGKGTVLLGAEELTQLLEGIIAEGG